MEAIGPDKTHEFLVLGLVVVVSLQFFLLLLMLYLDFGGRQIVRCIEERVKHIEANTKSLLQYQEDQARRLLRRRR